MPSTEGGDYDIWKYPGSKYWSVLLYLNRKSCKDWSTMKKLTQALFSGSNFTTNWYQIWQNYVTAFNTALQQILGWHRSFKVKGYENYLKYTNLVVSQHFQKTIYLLISLRTYIPNYKAIRWVVFEKKFSWPNMKK